MPKGSWGHYLALGGVLTGLLLGSPALCQEKGVEPSQKGQATKAAPKSEAKSTPPPYSLNVTVNPVIPEIPCDAACQEAEQSKEQRDKDDLVAQERMAYAAIAVGVFTFIQLLIGGFTLIYLIRTFSETKRTANAAVIAAHATKESADASSISARAAKDSVESLTIIERAYLYPGIENMGVSDGVIFYTLTAKNFGKTPAILDEFFIHTRYEEHLPATRSSVGHTIHPDRAFSAEEKAPVHTVWTIPKEHYVIGHLKYRDVFNREHSSNFCFQIYPESLIYYPAGGAAWNTCD